MWCSSLFYRVFCYQVTRSCSCHEIIKKKNWVTCSFWGKYALVEHEPSTLTLAAALISCTRLLYFFILCILCILYWYIFCCCVFCSFLFCFVSLCLVFILFFILFYMICLFYSCRAGGQQLPRGLPKAPAAEAGGGGGGSRRAASYYPGGSPGEGKGEGEVRTCCTKHNKIYLTRHVALIRRRP